jgi:hypothetical protein
VQKRGLAETARRRSGAADPETGALPSLAPNTFYLESVDDLHRRQYARTPA